MIWGLTHDEDITRARLEMLRIKKWHSWFAWHPVRLEDGRTAWLQVVERKWNGWWSGVDAWDYRPIKGGGSDGD